MPHSQPRQTSPHTTSKLAPPQWMTTVLIAAAIYNVVFGAWTVLFPNQLFALNGIAPPNYPELWQCVGMIVGVYGVGYFAAAFNPLRHWPIVLVGFLGKIFGPIGFAKALLVGSFPLSFGWILVTNDLIWWIPFFLILRAAYQQWLDNDLHKALALPVALKDTLTSTGNTLAEINQKQPVMVVLLRHMGCTFCREAMADLQKARQHIAATGVHPVIVHQSKPMIGQAWLEDYQLEDWTSISDPERTLYRALQLRRGTIGQLFGLNVWKRGWEAGINNGHGVGKLDGDGFQMPGLVMLYNNEVVAQYPFTDAADRPDYVAFVKEAIRNHNLPDGHNHHAA